mmetsp:Transcript_81136/g.173582  ORF Transcript_81136/g.173582 Transcript_81136/m.173582 type:complete len:217 (-) Transcript_81136:47-697(-)
MLTCWKAMTAERRNHQVVMLGLEGAGKTTLLYRLKMPLWKPREIVRDMEKNRRSDGKDWDPGYHYEELNIGRLKHHGVWDVPGSEAMINMWPTFYRYISVVAVLFVVDGSNAGAKDEAKLAKARNLLHFLLNEDELRVSAFVLVINERVGPQYPEERSNMQQIAHALGVHEIMEQDWNKSRFHMVNLNCAEVSTHAWEKVVEDIYRIYITWGGGTK